PRLVSTIGQRGEYLTLSYVWGGDQIHKTTSTNLSMYEQGIAPSILPPTIRDAIYVTHMLGFRWLWVDSLCIIQDSETDKAHEIGRMHHIYRYAHLTIIAAIAKSVNESFLQERPFDGYTMALPFLFPPYSTTTIGQPEDCSAAQSPRPNSKEREDMHTAWMRVVRDYTNRSVSVESDKLVACAALAEQFHPFLGSDYLAGLWRSDALLIHLLWKADGATAQQFELLHTRPTTYRAPSWSWAAIDGPTEY
ncbi:HET-domain-containing protein, partial [Trametes versicolor FP-101664 SS1]|uniref:HET-domain-containing protein n=1 Tax=Trametes versicolor (strain FP-101664) TaxID=717944 RepID=UPI0004624283